LRHPFLKVSEDRFHMVARPEAQRLQRKLQRHRARPAKASSDNFHDGPTRFGNPPGMGLEVTRGEV
jgi:hypothetical protein